MLVLGRVHGVLAVGAALLLNAALNAVLLLAGEAILRALGEGGRAALGKLASLLVATLGASMLRGGVMGALTP